MPRHHYGLNRVQLAQATALTIGVFDGVHRGHQRLMRQLTAVARERGLQAAAISFHPHPDELLRGRSGRFYLTEPAARARRLHELGVELVITQPFNEEIRRRPAAEFVKELRERLRVAAFVLGEGFAMGYQRQGDILFLRELGKQQGFTIHTVPIARAGATLIRSEVIREALRQGAVEWVRDELLGYAYEIRGRVMRGRQRGRTLGFPTANLRVWEGQLLPANGTYAGWAVVNHERYMALINLGKRPTFAEQKPAIEAHLLSFDREIYGEEMTLIFESFLRHEQKFDSASALSEQIARDIAAGLRILSAR